MLGLPITERHDVTENQQVLLSAFGVFHAVHHRVSPIRQRTVVDPELTVSRKGGGANSRRCFEKIVCQKQKNWDP